MEVSGTNRTTRLGSGFIGSVTRPMWALTGSTRATASIYGGTPIFRGAPRPRRPADSRATRAARTPGSTPGARILFGTMDTRCVRSTPRSVASGPTNQTLVPQTRLSRHSRTEISWILGRCRKNLERTRLSMIVAKNLTVRYGKVVALCDVSFSLTGQLIGVLGENGAGKTTLFEVLAGA